KAYGKGRKELMAEAETRTSSLEMQILRDSAFLVRVQNSRTSELNQTAGIWEGQVSRLDVPGATPEARATAQMLKANIRILKKELGRRSAELKAVANEQFPVFEREFTSRDIQDSLGRGEGAVRFTPEQTAQAIEIISGARDVLSGKTGIENVRPEIRDAVESLAKSDGFEHAVRESRIKHQLYLGLSKTAPPAELAKFAKGEVAKLRENASGMRGEGKKMALEEAQMLEDIAYEIDGWKPVRIEIDGVPRTVEARTTPIPRQVETLPETLREMRTLPPGVQIRIELNIEGRSQPEVWRLSYEGRAGGEAEHFGYTYESAPYEGKLGSTGAIRTESAREAWKKTGRLPTPLEMLTQNIMTARDAELQAAAAPRESPVAKRARARRKVAAKEKPKLNEVEQKEMLGKLGRAREMIEKYRETLKEPGLEQATRKYYLKALESAQKKVVELEAELSEAGVEGVGAPTATRRRSMPEERFLTKEEYRTQQEIARREVELLERPAEEIVEAEVRTKEVGEKAKVPPTEQEIIHFARSRAEVKEGEPVTEISGMRNKLIEGEALVKAIEQSIRAEVEAGAEYDVLIISADGTMVNDKNPVMQNYETDRSLNAYRLYVNTVLGKALKGVENAQAYAYRPFMRGDEYYAVVVVKKGQGNAVRKKMNSESVKQEALREVTDRARTNREEFPQTDQSLSLLGKEMDFAAGDFGVQMTSLSRANPKTVEDFSITRELMRADDQTGISRKISKETNVRGSAEATMTTPKFPENATVRIVENGREIDVPIRSLENAHVLDV
ncbi:MAG: hypothetical protein GY852_05390, partial [bacterium]|nr:hypothetical protein [bacterium]